jgi:hypothetical protein
VQGVDAATLAAPSSWPTAKAILPSIDDKGDQGLHMSFKHGQRKAAQEGDAEM